MQEAKKSMQGKGYLITVGWQCSMSKQARVRIGVAPQATGSKTQGRPRATACTSNNSASPWTRVVCHLQSMYFLFSGS